MSNAWLLPFISVVVISLVSNYNQWLQFVGIRELDCSDSDELSALQTHRIELIHVNPSNRSLTPHNVEKPLGKYAASSFPLLSKAMAIARTYNFSPSVQTAYLPFGTPMIESFATIPNPGTLIIEPGLPVPPFLALASKAITVFVGLLIVYQLISACCGSLGFFPKPIAFESEAERNAYGLALKDNWTLYCFLVSGTACQLFITSQYLPSFAQMAVDMKTDVNMMSLSLQVNWFVKGCSALFIGFYADQVGRKNLMVATAALQVLGSVTCGLASDINWFLAGRVFQGLAEGGEVLGMMIVRDVVDDMETRQKWTIGLLVPSVIFPVLSPSVGGMIAAAVGWRVPFAMVALWGTVNGIGVNMMIRETMIAKPPETNFFAEVVHVASNIHLTTLLLVASMMGMLSASVDTNLSIILTFTFRKSEVETSLLLGGLVLGYVVGLFFTRAFLETVSVLRQLQISMMLLVLPITSSFVVAAFATDSLWVFYMNLVMTGSLVLVAVLCADSLFMQPIKEMSGAGSGLKVWIGMFMVSVGSFISRIFVRLAVDEPRGLSNWQGAILVICFVGYWKIFGLRPPEWAHSDAEKQPSGLADGIDEKASLDKNDTEGVEEHPVMVTKQEHGPGTRRDLSLRPSCCEGLLCQ